MRVRETVVGLVAAAAGVALFVYAVRRAGLAEIIEGLRRVGVGFLLVLSCSAVREVARALAWTLCVERPHRLPFWQAFRARQTGEAIGNLTPLSLLASEPTKAFFVRHTVPLTSGLSSLAIDNVVYTFSVLLMIAAGATALLTSLTVPEALREVTLASIALVAAFGAAGIWLLRTRPRVASRLIERVAARFGKTALSRHAEQARTIEDGIYGFAGRNAGRLVPLSLLAATFHAAGVAEVYVTLGLLMGAWPTLLDAFVLESMNRLITVVFKVVPLRLGVDEAGTGLMTNVMGFGTTVGVTMAIVRKTRVLFWTLLGLISLVQRGIRPVRTLADAERLFTGDRGNDDAR